MELAELKAAGESFKCNHDPCHTGLEDPTAEDIMKQILRICHVHCKRGVDNLKNKVTPEQYLKLINFMYLPSKEAAKEFTDWVKGLGHPQVQGITQTVTIPGNEMEVKAAKEKAKMWLDGDKKVLTIIAKAVLVTKLYLIKDCTSAHATWKALQNEYEPHNTLSALVIMQQIIGNQCQPSDDPVAWLEAADKVKGRGSSLTGPSRFTGLANNKGPTGSPSRFSGTMEYMNDNDEEVGDVFEKVEDRFAFHMEVVGDCKDETEDIRVDEEVGINAVALNLDVPQNDLVNHNTGATRHIFCDRRYFQDYILLDPPLQVHGFGSSLLAVAVGKGTIVLKSLHNGVN
ncbi:hypothetical protein GYMLUDRAFT_239237 [Collybiopsis luxurians FD-317 M1]|nr:hypothetical protein GYMLUDRAFT_239237 [Collybiopsis luxurians FD-317 M1]